MKSACGKTLSQVLSGLDLPFDQLWMKDTCDSFDSLLKKTQQSQPRNMQEEVGFTAVFSVMMPFLPDFTS